MLAQKLGVWIPLDEVADVWEGVVGIFRDYGYRRLRSRARLKFLVADWGVEKFREVLENEYLDRELVDCPSPASPRGRRRPHRRARAEGRRVLRRRRPDGRPRHRRAAHPPRRPGRAVRRRGRPADRLPEARRPRRRARTRSRRSSPRWTGSGSRPGRSNWRTHTMACTGIEFCKLAIVDTKDRAADLVDELERRFPDLDTPITVNVNGCPNACARTQVADIGLKGQLVLDDDGHQVEGFQVHLGGGLGLRAASRSAGSCAPTRSPAPASTTTSTAVVQRLPGGPRGRRDVRRLGAPRRRGAAARRDRAAPGGRPMSERAVPFHCPYCGDENLRPHEADEGPHGAWECRACLRAFTPQDPRPDRAAPGPGEARHDAPTTTAARNFRGTTTEGRSEDELRDLVATPAPSSSSPRPRRSSSGRWPPSASASASPRRWPTPCWPTSPPRVAPGVDVVFLDTGYHFAETIGTRDAVEATLPVNLLTITPGADGRPSRTRRTARTSSPATPTCAARCARCAPLQEALAGYDAWATGLRRAETHNRVIAPVIGWDDAGSARSRSRRWPAGPTSDVDALHRRATACWSTRCSTTATPRSAAGRAPAASPPARTRAAAAGRAPARPSAASTPEPRPHDNTARPTPADPQTRPRRREAGS